MVQPVGRERQPSEASFLILFEKAAWGGGGKGSRKQWERQRHICRWKDLVGRKKEGGQPLFTKQEFRVSGIPPPPISVSYSLSRGRRQSPSCVCSRGPPGMAPRWVALSELVLFFQKWGDACLKRVLSLLGQRRVTAEGKKAGAAPWVSSEFSSVALRATGYYAPRDGHSWACNVPNERGIQIRRGKWQSRWGEQRSGRGFRSLARTRPGWCLRQIKGRKSFFLQLHWKLCMLSISLFPLPSRPRLPFPIQDGPGAPRPWLR